MTNKQLTNNFQFSKTNKWQMPDCVLKAEPWYLFGNCNLNFGN